MFSVAEWCGVVSVFSFEVVLSESDVFACYGGLVDYWWLYIYIVVLQFGFLDILATKINTTQIFYNKQKISLLVIVSGI